MSDETYEIFELLGRGSHTDVYRAKNIHTEQDVAIKTLNNENQSNEDLAQQLQEAAQFQANLGDYQHLIQIQQYEPRNHWLVMELMTGSLLDLIQKSPLPADRVENALRQALHGLQVLHEHGRCHGKIKPSNLLIDRQNRVKLADSPGLLVNGVARSPENCKYAAPEQLNTAFGSVGPQTDLYVLGFTALELLCGPDFDERFKGTGKQEMDPQSGWNQLHGSKSESLPSPDQLVRGLPLRLARVIQRLLRKDTSERYSSAQEALLELADDQKGSSTSSAIEQAPTAKPGSVSKPPIPPSPSPPKFIKPKSEPRKWRRYLPLGVLALAFVAVLLVILLRSGSTDEEPITVHIATVPEGATITFLDPDKPEKKPSDKKTNNTYLLKPQKQRIRLQSDGFETSEYDVDPREKQEYSFDLKKPGSATAAAGSEPEWMENSIKMKLRLISAGKFMMGSPETEAGREGDEGPRHEVAITRPFYMGAFEVTQEQYSAIMGTNPSWFDQENGGGPNYPVDGVSFQDAEEFCRRLSAKEKRSYRLPTEAEWEYACRAGTETPFNTGDRLQEANARFDAGSTKVTGKKGSKQLQTSPAGSYSPNPFGLHDMHGNVAEWCADWYGANHYATGANRDPAGPSQGSQRVLRGGSFQQPAKQCRSANRLRFNPAAGSVGFGFRVVLTIP